MGEGIIVTAIAVRLSFRIAKCEHDKLPRPWRDKTVKMPSVDALRLEVALTPDNKLALLVDSSNNQTLEVRLDPEAAPVIIQSLRRIQAELRRRQQ